MSAGMMTPEEAAAYAKAMSAANTAGSQAGVTSTVASHPINADDPYGQNYAKAMSDANSAASKASITSTVASHPYGADEPYDSAYRNTSTTPLVSPQPSILGNNLPPPTAAAPPLLSVPGAYEQWIKENAGQFSNPTAVENLYSTGAASKLGTSPLSSLSSGNVTDAYNAWLGGQNATSGIGASARMVGGGTGGGSSSGVLSSLSTTPSNATGVFNDTAKPQLNDPGAMEAFYSKYGADPMQKGYTENLYESGVGQLDPYYDYAQKRAMDSARNSSAARGGFNTGLAAQQESDIGANIRGQQAQQMFSLAPQADAAKVARETLGFGEANTAQSQEQARIKELSDAAQAGDQGDYQKNQLRVNAAGNADSSAAAMYSASVNAAGNADRAAIDAFNANTGAHYDAGQLGLAQQGQNTSLATQQDAAQRNNLDEQFKIATGVDNSQQGRLLTQGGLEKDLQNTGQDRLAGGLNATQGLSAAESKIAQNVWNDMGDVNSLDATKLQALAEKYGVTLQEMKDIVQAGGAVVNDGIKLAMGA